MLRFFSKLAAMIVFAGAAMAQTTPQAVGVVVMHGKGGLPTKTVAELAAGLEGKGHLVANIEMPWSANRNYDVNVAGAEAEVNTALARLRSKGAKHLFVAGHSQGGAFALYFGGKYPLDGIIAIAPGGGSDSAVNREKLGDSLDEARKLVAAGKGGETARLQDFEPSKGAYVVICKPDNYLSWFDPDGAMNRMQAIRSLKPETPVLYIVPKSDYPGLLKTKQAGFNALPRNPQTKLFEPDTNHMGAPSASRDEISRWMMEVAH